MARRLNKRMLVYILIFVGVPVVVLLIALGGGWVSSGNPQRYYEDAKKAVDAEDWTAAWPLIRNAVRAGGGKDPDIQFLMAQIALQQNPRAIQAAIQAYKMTLLLKHDHVEAQRGLAELYLGIGWQKEAKAECAKLIEMDPTYGRGYLWAAIVELRFAANEKSDANRAPYYEAAIARCRQGIEKAPDLLELYRLMASAYDRLDQADKVDETLDLAVEENPKTPEAYILKAGRLISLDRVQEAGDVLTQGLKVAGENARLYVALGEVAVSQKNPDAARGYFAKAITLDPKSEASYLRLSNMYRGDNLLEKAQETLVQGLKELPDSFNLRSEDADVLLEMGALKKADEQIDEISKMTKADEKADEKPDETGKAQLRVAAVNYLRGKRALRSMQVRQAITYLEKSRDTQPTPQASLLLGRAYLLADELGLAQRELESLLSLTNRSGLVSALRLLAEVQFRLRDLDKAALSARKVLDANPEDTDMHMLLVQTLVGQQKLPAALREIQTTVNLDPNNSEPLLLMADVYQAMNRLTDAEATIEKALVVSKNSGRVFQRFVAFYKDTHQSEKLSALLEKAKKILPEDEFIIDVSTTQELERQLKLRADKESAPPGAIIAMARLYQVTGRLDLAKEYLHKALTKSEAGSPDWRQAWNQLFLVELTGESYDGAVDLISQLRRVDPEAPELMFADPVLAMNQALKLKSPEEARKKLVEVADLLLAVTQSPRGRSMSQAYYLLGQVLVRQMKLEEAIVQLNKALELRPQFLPARLLVGHIYLRQNNLIGALNAASEALKFDPRLVPALDLRANAAAGLTNWADAIAAREDIAKIIPENIPNLFQLAALYIQRHASDKAEETFRRAYGLAPDNAMLVRGFADFYAESNRTAQGAKILDEYVDRHKDDVTAWIIRGEFTAKTSTSAEAEKYFRQAAKLAPQDPRPLTAMADEFARSGKFDNAIAGYLEAIKVKPDATEPKRHLADVYMLKNQLAEARQTIAEVLKADPGDVSAWVVAGRIASREDKAEEAQQDINKALSIDPTYGEAKVRLAELYAGPDPLKATGILESVDPSDPAFEKAMLLLAEIDTRRVQFDAAILHLRRLLDFRPRSMAGLLALASKYVVTRQSEKATVILQQLVKDSNGQDVGLLLGLGDALASQGKADLALDNYEKAAVLRPDSADALMGATRCLVTLGRSADAVQRIRRVMDNDPAAVWPRMALAYVYQNTNQPDQAIDTVRNGLLSRPDWEAGYAFLADLLSRGNKKEEAQQWLQTGMAKLPESLALRASLAALEIDAGRPAVAQKILEPLAQKFDQLGGGGGSPEKLDKLRPYLVPIRLYSLALYNQGKAEEAVSWGMKLWALDPTDVANANNMAWILATAFGRLDKADEIIKQCLRVVPNHPQVLDTAGWIAFLMKRYEEAADDLRASIKYGDNAEAHYHMGCLLEGTDRAEEARAEYKKALDMGLLEKDRDDARKRLDRLPR